MEEPKKSLKGSIVTLNRMWKFNILVEADVQIIEEVRKKGINMEVVKKILFLKMNPA